METEVRYIAEVDFGLEGHKDVQYKGYAYDWNETKYSETRVKRNLDITETCRLSENFYNLGMESRRSKLQVKGKATPLQA